MSSEWFNSNFVLNFGPQHPAAHGVLRLLVELQGEKVISVDPHIGFLHRGTEKLIENNNYLKSLPYFDRLDYVSMLSQEHCFILAVESLLNQNVSSKDNYVRTMFDEITRLLNHIMCITTHALDIGALTPFLWGFEEREKLLSFYEFISGARMHAAYYRIGGINFFVPIHILEKIYDFTLYYQNYINIIDDLLSNNIIWLTRLKNIGVIDKKSSLGFSFTGPLLRGSGIPWDLRKIQPYASYKDIQFSIPVGIMGDCYSRYLVRLNEMRESLKIIQQCINWLATNNNIDDTNQKNILLHNFNSLISGTLNSVSRSKSSMEELILHFKNTSSGPSVPEGEVYMAVEAPKGETGVYLVSDGSNKPYRCKIKAPGFLHLQGLEYITQGFLIADLVANIGSLDIVFGEIDR